MTIRISREKHIALITLDAQESLNALTIEDVLRLREVLVECQDDPETRAIILTGGGSKAFCAGANLKATNPPAQSFAQGVLKSRPGESKQQGYTRLIDLSDLEIWKPIIGAINGYCLGGGMELALQCDLRIASESASFALPEVKVASVPAVGGVQYLLRAVSSAHAMKMALTGDRIDAQQALRIGLVSDVVPGETLLDTAREIAHRIAANGPLAVQIVKKLALETAHLAPKDFVAQSNIHWGLVRDTEDRLEGRKAFAEKRLPVYNGQ